MYRQSIIKKFYKLISQLYYIQMKFIRQMKMKQGKLESLILYWDQYLQKVQMQAVKKKDKDNMLLSSYVLTMDHDLKVKFLKKWLHQCKLKHKMAFAQWRD